MADDAFRDLAVRQAALDRGPQKGTPASKSHRPVLLTAASPWYERGVKRLVITAALATLVGCGGSDPELSNFHIPTQVTVDEEVQARLSVYDEDGLGEMLFTVYMREGAVSHEVHHSIVASEDVTSGDLQLFISFFLPGTYAVIVTVTDEDGNESNGVSATVTAAPETGS